MKKSFYITIKSWSYALGATLLLGSASAAHAVSFTSTANLNGTFDITGFADSDPNTITLSLTNLNGKASIVVPPDGNYDAFASGTLTIDYGGPSTIALSLANTKLYSGAFSSTGVSTPHSTFSFSFPNRTITTPVTHTFSVDYNGIAFLGSLTGLPVPNGNGAGTMDVSYTVDSDSMTITIDDKYDPSTWQGIAYFLNNFDQSGNGDGKIDGRFMLNGSLTLTSIPEPTSLLLLSTGLASLGIVRRRKKAA